MVSINVPFIYSIFFFFCFFSLSTNSAFFTFVKLN